MKSHPSRIRFRALLAIATGLSHCILASERSETFDKDPGWDEHNNRSKSPEPQKIRQDFGYSSTSHAGGAVPGEMGGFIQPAAEPAYYAKAIPERTFNDAMSASGKIVCAGKQFHALLGFFNAGTINEWRTPNSIALRLQGRGDILYVYVEYTTSRWRAGGDTPGGFSLVREEKTGRMQFKGFPTGEMVHPWSMRYDPQGNGGTGSITVTMDGETAICHLDTGHKADGATFNRFGLINVMKQFDTGGELWLDDITVNGETESFDRDPKWDASQNRRTYTTNIVRPRFDFGYSATRHAGGKDAGEMGGLVFRGDGRFPEKMAFYGDRLEDMSLAKPLRASGKVSLRRGVTDSDVLLGFFHAEHSLQSNNSDAIGMPPDFLGISVGGPSREGFMIAPAYRLHNTERRTNERGPYLHPNGASHDWTLEYAPGSPDGPGTITATLDGEKVTMPIPREHLAMGAHFNRFGLISTHTDGNGQHLYFDDLSYTWTQKGLPAHRTLQGHGGSVLAVAFSPDGTLLASAARDKTIRLWDARTGEARGTLEGHAADVYSVVFSHDGKTLVSGSGDHTIRVWDASTAKLLRTLDAHSDVIRAVVFSPDGATLASTGADLTVKLWNTRTWELRATLNGHEARVKSLAFSPDGRWLASGGDDKSVRIWDVAQAALVTRFQAHEGPLETLAFSPDGNSLATSSNDATVRLWDTGSWKLLRTLAGHRGEVDSIAFSPDGKTLASGAKDRTLKLWDPSTGKLSNTIAAHDDRLESLTISPDGRTLASGSGGQDATIKLWDVAALEK